MDSSYCTAEWHCSWQSPRPPPVLAPPVIPDPPLRSSRTHSRFRTRRLVVHVPRPITRLEAVTAPGTRQPAVPAPGPVTRLEAVTSHRTRHPATPGPVNRSEVVPIPGTRRPAVPGPVTSLGAIIFNKTHPAPGPVNFLDSAPGPRTLLLPVPKRGQRLIRRTSALLLRRMD